VPAGANPIAIAVNPDGNSVYVTNAGSGVSSGTVSQYDVGAGGALSPKSPATVPAGDGPVGIAVSPDGHSVYVPNNDSTDVSQYTVGAGGALSPKSPATVPAGLFPSGGVAVSPDGNQVFVALNGGAVAQYAVGTGGALSPENPATVAAGTPSM
jgi:DNA-binding beta-propeller fold protein YncE